MSSVIPYSSNTKKLFFFLLSFITGYSTLSCQTTLNVPADYATIQEALDVAEVNSTIKVQPGTYHEHLIWPKDIDGIKLIGVEGKENTIIDGSGNGTVLSIANWASWPEAEATLINQATLIDGFTLQNGGGSSPGVGPFDSSQEGICIYIRYAHPTLKNLIIKDNHCTHEVWGGCAVYMDGYSGSIINCDFIDNSINTSSTRAHAAGAFIDVQDTLIIDNCRFENNHTIGTSSTAGALWLSPSISWDDRINKVEIINTEFINNSAIGSDIDGFAGAIYAESYNASMHIEIDFCTFDNNTASRSGSAISSNVDVNISNTEFTNNASGDGSTILINNNNTSLGPLVLSNVIIASNDQLNPDSEPSCTIGFYRSAYGITFSNCQINNNTSNYIIKEFKPNMASKFYMKNSTVANNSGSIYVGSTRVSMTNSILWNNGPFEIDTSEWGSHSTLNINNNIIRGGMQGTDNKDEDPLLQNGQLLIPSLDSPCIANGTIINAPTMDLLGNLRPMPVNSVPDIGAIEVNQVVSNLSDLNDISIYLYPNPANDQLYFSEPIDKGYIADYHGKVIKEFGAISTLNLTYVDTGVYLITFNKEGKTSKKKIVIVK